MSTIPPLPDPGEPAPLETELAESLATDASPPDSGEPFLAAEAVPEEDEVFVAELADPEEAPPRRQRPRSPARSLSLALPPPPPHPGFAWAVGWCLLMLFLAQLVVPVVLAIGIIIVQGIRIWDLAEAGHWFLANLYEPELLVPLQMSAHVTIFVMALLALRLVAGRSWPRQVAIRLPAVGHVLLALVGAPAFWLLSGALMLGASRVVPKFQELPSLVVVVALLMAIVGAYWLAVRLTTGRDWVRELARAPLRTQLVLGPLGLLLLLLAAVQAYRIISPYVFEIPQLSEEEVAKGFGALFQIPWWAVLLVIAVTPAFSEEFWCRAFLGRGLVGTHGYVMGIIWTSVFFGAIHLYPPQAAMAMVLGIVLHSGYVASRSMLIPMLMHFLNNGIAVLASKFLKEVRPSLEAVENDPGQVPWIWFVAALFLGVAVLWAFYTSRARLVRDDGSDLPPWQPPYPTVAYPPPNSGTAVVYPWPGVWPTLAVIAGVIALGSALYWG